MVIPAGLFSCHSLQNRKLLRDPRGQQLERICVKANYAGKYWMLTFTQSYKSITVAREPSGIVSMACCIELGSQGAMLTLRISLAVTIGLAVVCEAPSAVNLASTPCHMAGIPKSVCPSLKGQAAAGWVHGNTPRFWLRLGSPGGRWLRVAGCHAAGLIRKGGGRYLHGACKLPWHRPEPS